jgi:hypothetical protein
MQREWSNFISDNLKVPVVSLDELRAKYSFGIKEGIQMTLSALIVIIIVYLIFQFNDEILSFLTKEELTWKILASMCVFVFVPVFAYLYSTVTKLFLRIIKFE